MSKLSAINSNQNDTFGAASVLSSIFASFVLLSNILSTKIINIAGLANDAGTLIYPFTFVVKDIIQKKYGRAAARRVIWTTYGILAFAFLCLWIVGKIPPDASWANQEAYDAVLTPFGRLVVASIISGIISELLDTRVFSYLWKKTQQVWVALISNVVGIAVDTALFALIAFYGDLPVEALWGVFITNMIMKLALSSLAAPSILLVKPTAKELV
jgi:uncharacterized integral membrane protein (TIGR00697 family)|nr:MAG TPA: Putative vitamin uptake transporter [Caudoviricetes sp.]